ncbi:NAD-glutamate dehydrogenase domain-containing protein [Methylocystis sp. S23]|jgi:glutamate dehydrogenase
MDTDTDLRRLASRSKRKPRLKDSLRLAEIEFSPGYCDLVAPRQRARDLLRLGAGGEPIDLRRLGNRPEFDLRIYGAEPRALDELIPVLHNLGLTVVDQVRFAVKLAAQERFIRSFLISAGDGARLQRSKPRILEALTALLSGEAEDDPLNALILLAELSWREIGVLRTYCNYYLQLGGPVDRSRLYQAILGQVDVTRQLFAYFDTRFRPDHASRGSFDAVAEIRQRIGSGLDLVTNLTDDRILRDMFNLIDATLRTNFYSVDRKSKTLALKIDSLGVIGAPSPRPMVEIFVDAPFMEGIHLRGAKVARGGIRWSDRAHDLRSEILGLMQTQMIKNALIVPQGAKGGFVLKPPWPEGARREELGEAAYRGFILALLELTDDFDEAGQRSRSGRVDYDDADPYLVVAADKGTGAWSDIANEIARSRGFWLGDAFATGGSNGFHHKRLGITARGAWVCVRRHFRELGRSVDDQPVSVVGVGSMDGDVFGNGMLETRTIRLLGAFNGEHIFLDPNPDPLSSYDERRRLFETPRSTWADYNASKISAGGGIYRRDAKDIELSPEARSWLQSRNRFVDGETLIRLLLTAPADLLWMGGVGTYVKASEETDEDVGDRANDGARVNAGQLRVKVVAEGANLGLTQRGRVEYALNGGRINMDAVDNSAGVDLSDHEVNLKILLRYPDREASGGSDGARRLLESLTDAVCDTVLDDNYRQSLSISLERERSVADIGPYMDLADRFEVSGEFDRSRDAFPSRRELAARTEKGLTRPELALLTAHAKLALKRALLETDFLFDAEWIENLLASYFPDAIRSRYRERMRSHPLAKEIAATVVCNRIVDQAGARFLLFGDPLAPDMLLDAVGLYLFFDLVLEGERWRKAVRSLDGRMNSGRQYQYLLQLEDSLAYLCRWALQKGLRLRPDRQVEEWRAHLRDYLAHFTRSAEASVLDSNAPEASRELFLDRLRDFPFLVALAQQAGKDMGVAAGVFDSFVDFLELRQIAALAAETTARDAWEGRLQASVDERLRAVPARIAAIALRMGTDAPDAIFRHAGAAPQLTRLRRLRSEILEAEPKSIAPFALFASELQALAEACEASRRPSHG